MKRFPLALLLFLGLVTPVLGNPLDVLTRAEKGAALSQTDNDTNFSLIETAVHNLQPITLQTAPCTIPMGCTGAATLPSGLLKGAGVGPIVAAVPGTDFQIPIVSTGVLKGTGSAVGSAVAGTDYQAPITVSGVLKGAGGGNIAAAVAGTDYQAPVTATGVLKGSGTSVVQATAGTDYQAPVSATGILKSNGTSGNVVASVAGTDYQVPVTATGVLKGSGTAVASAVAGTDYQAPVSATGILKSNGTPGNVAAAVANTDYEAADSDTLCLANATTNGFHVRTGTGTCREAQLTAGTGIAITNPTGSSDPVISTTALQGATTQANQNFTTATVSDITGLSIPLVQTHAYEILCTLLIAPSATSVGVTIAVQRPAGDNSFEIRYPTAANNVVGTDSFNECATGGNTASGGAGCAFTTSPSTGPIPLTIRGFVHPTTGNGTLQVQAANPGATGTLVMRAASGCAAIDRGTM